MTGIRMGSGSTWANTPSEIRIGNGTSWSGGAGSVLYRGDGTSWTEVWRWPEQVVGFSLATVDHDTVQAAWTGFSWASGYVLAYRESPSGTWNYQYPASSPSSISGLNPDTTYEAQVYAFITYDTNTLNGAYSTSDTATTDATGPDAAPTGVSVSQVAGYLDSRLKVDWTDASTDETGFYIYRNTTNDSGTAVQKGDVGAGIETWTDETGQLEDGRTYYYWVTAYNLDGETSAVGASNHTEISPPTSLSATRDATDPDTQINLTWTENSTNATEQRIYHSVTSSSGPWDTPVTVGATNWAYEYTGLASGTQHWFKVVGYNATAGESVAATATETTAATPVGDVTDLAAVGTCSGADLSWSDVTGETEYRIYKRQGADTFALHDTIGAGATSYPVTGLSGGSWDFQVRGWNSGYGEGISNTATALQLSVPSNGTIDSVTQPNENSLVEQRIVRVAYSGFGDATAYTVERSTDGGLWVVLTTAAGAVAYDDNSDAASNSWATGIADSGTPTENSKTSTSITLNLSGYVADGLQIQRKTGAGGSWSTIANDIKTTTYEDTGLSASTEYYYRVRNVDQAIADVLTYRVKGTNDCGSSSYVEWLTGISPEEVSGWVGSAAITTDALSPPTAPSGGTAQDNSVPPTFFEVLVTWTDNSSNEDGFKIYRSLNGGGFDFLASPAANATSHNDDTVADGDVVIYRIYSYNAAGNSTTGTETNSVTVGSDA